MNGSIRRVLEVYEGSDADATRQLYAALAASGPSGELAMNLMRACKKSERAKVYRGSRYRSASYDGKQWAMGEVCKVLLAYPGCWEWGWGVDEKQEYHRHVLYVDLPNGQVSFHTAMRGAGPSYPGKWDGKTGMGAQRVCQFAASVLDASRIVDEALA